MKLFLISLLISQVVGQASFKCGADGTITSSGSTTVFPITQKASVAYKKTCKGVTVTVNGTGSSVGARSVCGDTSKGDEAKDIGNMSREFNSKEATAIVDQPGYFKCIIPAAAAVKREVIRMPVAIDGLTIFTKRFGDEYKECIAKITANIDVKIVRWMFSNFTDLEYELTGTKDTFFDNNTSTKLWSELFPTCPKIQIPILGPSATFGTSDYFKEIVFTGGPTEGYRSGFIGLEDNSPALTNAVINTRYGLGFMGFAYYNQNIGTLAALPIELSTPTQDTLENGLYKLFARRIYSMYWNDAEVLKKSKCFALFTYSTTGRATVDATGFLPLPDIDTPPLYSLMPGDSCDPPSVTRSPTPKPTRPPVCNCFFLFRALRLCCRN